jgi:hypothetical protein
VASKSLRPEVAAELRAQYTRLGAEAEAKVHELHLERNDLEAEERSSASRHLRAVEKQSILDAAKSGLLGTHATERLLRDVDARLVELDDDHGEGPAEAGAGKARGQ